MFLEPKQRQQVAVGLGIRKCVVDRSLLVLLIVKHLYLNSYFLDRLHILMEDCKPKLVKAEQAMLAEWIPLVGNHLFVALSMKVIEELEL